MALLIIAASFLFIVTVPDQALNHHNSIQPYVTIEVLKRKQSKSPQTLTGRRGFLLNDLRNSVLKNYAGILGFNWFRSF
uniref:Secreted protein n=2 Tax=Paenibacillus polymyxa TaxID=1406 RepID=A0AAE9I937_PAEPO